MILCICEYKVDSGTSQNGKPESCLELVVLRVLLVLVLLRVATADNVDELDLEREVGLGRNAASEAALACRLANEFHGLAHNVSLRRAVLLIVLFLRRERLMPLSRPRRDLKEGGLTRAVRPGETGDKDKRAGRCKWRCGGAG